MSNQKGPTESKFVSGVFR